MTDAQIEAKSRILTDTLTVWESATTKQVRDSVSKAHAHAIKALTETLKRKPVGRSSIRQAKGSPSYLAACRDLDNLWTYLTGSSVASLEGQIRYARQAFYRESFHWWVKHLPDTVTTASTEPNNDRLREIRVLALHGTDVRAEIGPKIAAAKANLLATLERASRPGVLTTAATDLIDGWATQSQQAITQSVLTCLSDSLIAVEGYAMVDAIKPEFHPQDGYTPLGV